VGKPQVRNDSGESSREMEFEWNERKAITNERKHGVSFHEAASVFGDPLAITFPDPDRSERENRFITFGLSRFGRLLVIAHADRGSRTRIISARLMTKHERRIYEEE
jgi:uncharacterized DUF497 family protein